jgi:GR25 family glycosyltransferase involved in LPS biosynthesis
MITHTYFICNIEKEHDRYKHLQYQIDLFNIVNYTFISRCWKDDITEGLRIKWVKTDTAMRTHGRHMETNPLTNGEISLFLNYIDCLTTIKNTYNDGIFIIFESDVIFNRNYIAYIDAFIDSIKDNKEWDIINIGTGIGGKSAVLNNNNIIYKVVINRCAEGLVWNYKSVCKFLDMFNELQDIDSPIDTKMDYYSAQGKFNIYWSNPSLVSQGSTTHRFKSTLR